VGLLLDEVAFWNHEGANPSEEIIKAPKPSMATVALVRV
jgi:hypothetical protein